MSVTITLICKQCFTDFETTRRNQKFHSKACAEKARKGIPPKSASKKVYPVKSGSIVIGGLRRAINSGGY